MRAVHLVPYDAVGGVEVAAKSIADSTYDGFSFSRLYLADKQRNESENQPGVYFRALSRLLRLKPDLVIASLWRCCALVLIYKLLRPKAKVVTFLHLAHCVHFPDFIFNHLAMMISDEIWADSQTTLTARVPRRFRSKSKVISFLVERSDEVAPRQPLPNFVFWGRLHSQKGLGRAIRLFSQLQGMIPSATFSVIGPDGGELSGLERQIREAGIKHVQFVGSMDRAEIFELSQGYSFYLQTSVDEGMAMSVVEAMQLGLVPVVTPVGEIPRYCQDGHNAVLVHDDEGAVRSVLRLLDDPEEYQRLSRNAVQTWQDKPLYRDDVLEACRHVLAV